MKIYMDGSVRQSLAQQFAQGEAAWWVSDARWRNQPEKPAEVICKLSMTMGTPNYKADPKPDDMVALQGATVGWLFKEVHVLTCLTKLTGVKEL